MIVSAIIAMLAYSVSTLYQHDQAQQNGTRIQRSRNVLSSEMRFEGIGLSLLLYLSSSGLTSWFAVVNCRRCIQIQKAAFGILGGTGLGAVATARHV